uniref:Uncharacterized protein n=1 Tax=Rhizophora mucronata TaxID=61149 RepID=A0A2P2PWN9_RHIMU
MGLFILIDEQTTLQFEKSWTVRLILKSLENRTREDVGTDRAASREAQDG